MRQFGFTLVELLVVLTIIAIIMSLLVPAVGTARLQTKAVVCSSNIKQILYSLTIYEQENGTFPNGFDDSMLPSLQLTAGYPGDPSRGDKIGRWWFQCLDSISASVIENNKILWCPSRCIEDPSPKRNILCGNYGVNRAICKDAGGPSGTIGSPYVGTPLSLSKISNPQNILLIIDSGYSLISWEGATNANIPPCENTLRADAFYVPGVSANIQRLSSSPAKQYSVIKKRPKDYSINELNKDDAVMGRHRQKTINTGYVDGHTKRLKPEELFVREENGIYRNIQAWLPE